MQFVARELECVPYLAELVIGIEIERNIEVSGCKLVGGDSQLGKRNNNAVRYIPAQPKRRGYQNECSGSKRDFSRLSDRIDLIEQTKALLGNVRIDIVDHLADTIQNVIDLVVQPKLDC